MNNHNPAMPANSVQSTKLVRPFVTKLLYITSFLIFINVLISIYLTYQYYFPQEQAICNINSTFNCIEVSQTKYAVLFGVPVALFGILFYLGLFIASIGVALNIPFHKIYKKLRPQKVLDLARLAAYFGLLFSLYLTYVEFAIIYVFCIFCLIQQVLIIIIVILYIWINNVINKGKKETNICEFC
jgi:uncharacterized membrane protein